MNNIKNMKLFEFLFGFTIRWKKESRSKIQFIVD